MGANLNTFMPKTQQIFKRYFQKFSTAGKLIEEAADSGLVEVYDYDDEGEHDYSDHYARFEEPAQQRLGEDAGVHLGTTCVQDGDGGPSSS